MPICKICGKEKTDFTPGGLRRHICVDCMVLPKETRDEMHTITLLRTMPMVLSDTQRKWLRRTLETHESEIVRRVALEEYKKRYPGHRALGLGK